MQRDIKLGVCSNILYSLIRRFRIKSSAEIVYPQHINAIKLLKDYL